MAIISWERAGGVGGGGVIWLLWASKLWPSSPLANRVSQMLAGEVFWLFWKSHPHGITRGAATHGLICCCIAPIFILWDLCGDANGLTQAVSLKLIDSFTCQIRQGVEKLKMCPPVTRSGFYSWLLHVWRTLLLFWLDSPWGVGPTWDPALEVGFRDTRKMLMGRIHHHAGSSTGWPFAKRNSGVAAAGTLAPFHPQGIYSNGMTHK